MISFKSEHFKVEARKRKLKKTDNDSKENNRLTAVDFTKHNILNYVFKEINIFPLLSSVS